MSAALGRALVALALASLVALLASPGQAQRRRRAPREELAPLAAAEQAYAQGELDTVSEHAFTALTEGGHTPRDLVRIYFLLGVCATVFGDPDGARDFYQRMLAIDATATLDDTVGPSDRGPYLEARGIVTARPERLGATGSFVRSRGALRLTLLDPFEMAHAVRVHARLAGTEAYATSDHALAQGETSHDVVVEIPGAVEAERVEYFTEVLDEYGNQLLLEGDAIEPRVVGRLADVGPADSPAGSEEGGHDIVEDPLFWIITVGAVLVVGGVVTGIVVDQTTQLRVQTTVTAGF